MVSVILNLLVALFIVNQVNNEGIQTLHMGGWSPPYGIVFVADMLAALMVLTTLIVGTPVCSIPFGASGREREALLLCLFQFCWLV